MSVATETCLHPQLAPESGYRYGCRCSRCRARRVAPISSVCSQPNCERLRLKGRRTCLEHTPPKGIPSTKTMVDACLFCGGPWGYYESTVQVKRPEVRELYRRVCGDCRRPVTYALRQYRLDTEQALRFLSASVCECCGERLPSRWGRRRVEVDHDHACCPGAHSCGSCVRGFVCSACNREIGQWEAMTRRGRGAEIAAYLAAARDDRDIDW